GPRGVASPWMTRRTLEDVEITVTARAEAVACGGSTDDARRALTVQLGDDARRPLEPGIRVDRKDLLLAALDVALEQVDPPLAALGEQRRQVDGGAVSGIVADHFLDHDRVRALGAAHAETRWAGPEPALEKARPLTVWRQVASRDGRVVRIGLQRHHA